MHELGVVFHVIDSVEAVAKENNATHVQSVTLEIGTVSGVVPAYLEDCWNWAVKKHELLTECKLIIEDIPAITYCEDCGNQYDTIRHGKICPQCQSEHTYLLQGNEFNIKEMEVY